MLSDCFRRTEQATTLQSDRFGGRRIVGTCRGYEWYLKGLETRHDPNAAQVKTAFEDYMACMKAVLKKGCRTAEGQRYS